MWCNLPQLGLFKSLVSDLGKRKVFVSFFRLQTQFFFNLNTQKLNGCKVLCATGKRTLLQPIKIFVLFRNIKQYFCRAKDYNISI